MIDYFPEDPTPEQLKAIVLALIRNVFEPSATDIGEVVGDDNGWSTTYKANGQQFKITYSSRDGFTKGPVNLMNKSQEFAEFDVLEDSKWDEMANAVADPNLRSKIVKEAMRSLEELTE